MQPSPPPHQPPEPTWLTWFFYKVYYPFRTVRSIYLSAFALALFFLILAIVQISVYSSGFEQKVLYSQGSKCLTRSTDERCEVQLEIKQSLQPPILFMYLIENAYINHRKYIDSVSADQLAGKTIDAATAQKACTPYTYNSDLAVNRSYTGAPLIPDYVASPCGFTAALAFNDTFSLYDSSGAKIPIDQSNITLKLNDYESFKRQPFSDQDQWMDPIDGHFINWMKNEALITKYKLWGRIEQPLPAGNYSVVVENNYHIGELRIKKGIEIVVPTSFGGQIYFFPIVYLLMFAICVAYGIFVYVKLRFYDELVRKEAQGRERRQEMIKKSKH